MKFRIVMEGVNMEYLTTTEMSVKWGISSRRIATLCEKDRIDGVVKKGKTWLVPCNAQRPFDARKKNNAREKNDGKNNNSVS